MTKLFRYLKGLEKECVLGPLLKLAEAVLELFVPYVIMNILKTGVPSGDVPYIVKSSLLLVGMGFAGLLFSVSAQFFCSKAACSFSASVRKALFDKILSMPASETDKIGKSTLITRLTGDVEQVQTGVNLTLRLLLRAPVIVFGAMILAFTVNAKGALIFCVLIPVLLAIVFSVMLTASPLQSKTRGILDKLTLTTRENLSGVRVIRALCLEDKEEKRFSDTSENLKKAQTKAGTVFSLMNPLTYVTVNLCIVALVFRGEGLYGKGLIETAEIIALYNYMTQILAELIKFANLIITVIKAEICGDRINAVLTNGEKQNISGEAPDTIGCELEFDNVSFSYHKGGTPALKNISFRINKGERIGIIGGTGSGKTTLVNLITRTYDADCGNIYVRGKNILSFPPEELRKTLGTVPQKSDLFCGTVRSNMFYGKESADESEIYSALEKAAADGFVKDLGGLDYPVAQNGKNLSGGQRQRIAIARALIKKPDILIFDDSFSAIDYATEKHIRGSLDRLDSDTTVIIVSQRVSSLAGCDKILVIENGCAEGFGSHGELMNTCPTYREIYETQTKGENVNE